MIHKLLEEHSKWLRKILSFHRLSSVVSDVPNIGLVHEFGGKEQESVVNTRGGGLKSHLLAQPSQIMYKIQGRD